MTKTAEQVIARAHRRIRVLAADEPVTAEMQDLGTEVLEGLFAKVQTQATIAWTLDTVPDDVFLDFSDMLAAYLATEYNRPFNMSPAKAFLSFMECVRPSDAVDRADVDEDDTISEAEEDADLRAQFY